MNQLLLSTSNDVQYKSGTSSVQVRMCVVQASFGSKGHYFIRILSKERIIITLTNISSKNGQ